jgi:glycine amidinotransferase
MLSRNEWDPLKKVIVGTATNAQIPKMDRSLRIINYADRSNISDVRSGPYPDKVIDEANEDLEKLCETLISLDIKVVRPDPNHLPNYYNYCPRDTVLIHDQTIIAAPMPLESRAGEWISIHEHLSGYNIPIQDITLDRIPDLYNSNAIGNKQVLALHETVPAFDAANILRCNDNLFYLVSNTGNAHGYKHLQSLVGDNVKVWPVKNVYAYAHIDSTIALLREGLMLLNPSRIRSIEQLPKPLQNWDVIWSPEPVDLGYHPGYAMASIWVWTVNLLSINPNLVIIEEHQTELARQLSKHKIDSIMLPGRQQRTLSGGFHCVTLDLERDHH